MPAPRRPDQPLTAAKKARLLAQADRLAAQLTGGQVSRAELRPVLNVLFLTPLPWEERLAQARDIVRELPGSWAAKRSKTAPVQYRTVRQVIEPLLKGSPGEEELRFLLGWTARQVHVRSLARRT